LEVGSKLIDKLFPDPQKKAEALLKLKELEQSGDLAVIAGQNSVNAVEAANANIFISGWRPACGWVCVSGLAYTVFLSPLTAGLAALLGHAVTMPVIPNETIITLLVGMLGLGGMRTVEKLSGVAAK
jgi:hypothetical protein